MYKCPLCNKDFDRVKQLHAHMLAMHRADFEKKGFKLSNYGITFDPAERASKNKPGRSPGSSRTAGDPETEIKGQIRLLNLADPAESRAYDAGYRYIAGDDLFTAAEAKERRLI